MYNIYVAEKKQKEESIKKQMEEKEKKIKTQRKSILIISKLRGSD